MSTLSIPVARLDALKAWLNRLAPAGGVVWLMVALLLLTAALLSEDFRSVRNLSNLTRQNMALSLVSLAQFGVVLTGGVDLSVGATVKLTTIVAAIIMDGADGRLIPAVLAALAIGLGIGGLNGWLVTRLKIPAFIATLGTWQIFRGLALFVAPIPTGRTSPLLVNAYSWQIGPIFGLVLLTALIWLLVWFLLYRTVWGRHVYAIGGDMRVALLSGIRTQRVQWSVFALAGLLAGVAGILTAASTGVGDPNAGLGLEFESLAAVVIGGASLLGGRGTITGALGGVLLLGIIRNMFNLLKVEVWYQQLLRGLIILVAVAVYAQKSRGK